MASKEPRLRWHEGNQIDLLQNGGKFFPALCEAIDAAQTSVHLETYIFNLDQTGERVLGHLHKACQRGVKVRVVLDGFGSALYAQEISRRFADMGVQYRVYRPEPKGLGHFRFDLRRLRRLHRKVAVIDGRIAFVGGINIIDDLEDVPDDGVDAKPRFDFAVRLQGPIVVDVERTLSRLWLRMAWRRRDDWAAFYQRLKGWSQRRDWSREQAAVHFDPGMRATLLLRDNIRFRQTIENVYIGAIRHAKNDILLANAYFFPGRRLRLALVHAAARGVRVRLLLQGRSEYPMQYRACRYMYCKVLDDGIEIYEYMASYLHAKVAVIDDGAMVGSSNLDPFSLLLAREANVFVQDAGFADELKTALETEIATNSTQVTEQSLQRRTFIGRYIDAASYMMLRIGVALTGKSSQY
ncbi:MAG TPA: cardiolipin synthase ClsB [Eoetvoesiella sp.]